jgi:protoporphyrinogen oxidase
MDAERFEHIVLGAGLRGLQAALRIRRGHPTASLLVVDAAPRAGGAVRTQRSNGFVCELGPFAFAADELAPWLAALQQPPRTVAALESGRQGCRFDGTRMHPIDAEPLPVSFATGAEELVQACRRDLGAALRLGRAATALHPGDTGWEVELGGEAPSRLAAGALTIALPTSATALLLAGCDRELAACAQRLVDEHRAFVFFGGHGSDAPELRGHGIVPTGDLDTPCAEMIFCTQVFAQRALPGRFLVRIELAGAAASADDATAVAIAEAELRRWTGTRAPLPFAKLHRFTIEAEDAALVECRVRLQALAGRSDTLRLATDHA